MQTEIVPQADVKPPESDPGAEKPEPAPVETTEAPKPSREELQRAVGAANTARRRLERDLAEERLKQDVANKRIDDLYKRFAPAEPKPPDVNEDPVGAITHKTDKIDQRLDNWEKREQDRERRENQYRQRTEIEQHWERDAGAFATKQPDFPQAYEFLFRNAMEEYTESYGEQKAAELVQGYWSDIVALSRRDGFSAAEKIYGLAKRRGYKAATSQDKIDTIVNGSKATSPLSASGKAPSRLTMETIADMKQEDFDKLSDADFKRVFGG